MPYISDRVGTFSVNQTPRLVGSENEAAADRAPGGETASGVQFWDPDRNPALGLESIGFDALLHRHALLLLASPAARDEGWAHGAAIALARELSARGRQVVLADLDFRDPALHARLGEPNADGISDVFFFGASLDHVALTWSARAFSIIPAGVGVLDPRVILEHPGWTRLLARFEVAGGPMGDLLLAFVPAEATGLEALASRIGAAVILGLEQECAAIETALPADVQHVAAFAPAAVAPHIHAGQETLVPRPIVGGPSEAVMPLPATAASVATADARAGSAPRSQDDVSHRRLARALTLAAILLLSVLVGLWHFGAPDVLLLRDEGLTDSLVERTGRLPQ